MFGYVKPHVAELKVGEYEKYRSVYCGLCRSMGRVTGQISRLSLSYDLTFLASVRMSVCGVTPEFEAYRCPAHISKKRLVMCDNEALRYTAAISAVLADAKLADDITDERGMKRIRAVCASPFTRHMVSLTKNTISSEISVETSKLLANLSELERDGCDSMNLTADAFGAVLEYVFSFGLSGEAFELASKIGRYIGRFIYICDAADDMIHDIKAGRYNPISLAWGDLATTDGKMSPLVRDSVITAAPIELEALGEAAEKLPADHVMTPIIKNIVYLGLPAVLERILDGDSGEGERGGI